MIAPIIILVLCSAFFSSVETAYTTVNKLRLEKTAQEKRSARRALAVEERFSDALTAILVGNNIVNIVFSTLFTLLLMRWGVFGESALGVVSTLLSAGVLLVFGEIIPKLIGKKLSLPLACATWLPLRCLMVILAPVTYLVNGIVSLLCRLSRRGKKEAAGDSATEEELATIIETVEEEGVIDEESGDLLHSALEFSDVPVEQIMTPRIDVCAIDEGDSPAEVLAYVKEKNHSRFPVFHESVDHIRGIFTLSSFLKDVALHGIENVKIADHVRTTAFVHKTTKLPDALEKMRAMQVHMIVVLDEYGGTLGIVTMEQILEEIVGDIWDETDVIETEITRVGERTYEVSGQTAIDDLFDEIDFSDRDFESEYTTVGGWAVEMLEENVHEGDSFKYKDLYVIVSEMRDNLVHKLTVILSEPSEEDEHPAQEE